MVVNEFINFLRNWQSLAGAFLGAAAPITFWFYVELHRKREKSREGLYYLEKILVYNINMVAENHVTIKNFIENCLVELINRIDRATLDKIYAAHVVFFPLFSHPTAENLLNAHTASGYLDNKILQTSRMTRDYALIIEDLRNQFSSTIALSHKIAFNKLNSSVAQNNYHKRNIKEFIKIVNRDFFEKNEKVYIKVLVNALVAVNAIRDMGFLRWRIKFSPNFKFFKNESELKKFRNETTDRIDQFLKEKIDVKIKEIEKVYGLTLGE